MIKVGITGGIGSGKTAFCKEWERLGAFVLYADDFAKQLMQEDAELKEKIKSTFGNKAYDADGQLNRAFLAKEAFQKGRVEELNKLVHPVLWDRIDTVAEQKKQEGVKVFAKEAAILLNHGRPEELDYVIIVMADEEERIKRTADRDEATRQQVKDRVDKQPDFESLLHLADYVVLNNNTLDDLKQKAEKIYNQLV